MENLKIKGVELDKNKNKIFRIKSAILWGHSDNNTSYPIAYLKKPKYMTDEQFEHILDKLKITFKD